MKRMQWYGPRMRWSNPKRGGKPVPRQRLPNEEPPPSSRLRAHRLARRVRNAIARLSRWLNRRRQ